MDEERRRWFAQQVERLTDRLYGTALRLTRNAEDAEDLVAEKAWGKLGRASCSISGAAEPIRAAPRPSECPNDRVTTRRQHVLSGTLHFAHGDFDAAKTVALGPGSVAIMPPGAPMFGYTSEETVIQLHGTGPWGLRYLNPADDPRTN